MQSHLGRFIAIANSLQSQSLGCTCKKTLPIQTGNVMCRWAAPRIRTNADFGAAEVHNGLRKCQMQMACTCPGQASENQDAIALRSQVKYYPGNRFVSFRLCHHLTNRAQALSALSCPHSLHAFGLIRVATGDPVLAGCYVRRLRDATKTQES